VVVNVSVTFWDKKNWFEGRYFSRTWHPSRWLIGSSTRLIAF
jgi:hypothetical protein